MSLLADHPTGVELLSASLAEYYTDASHLTEVQRIIEHKDQQVTQRLLEHLVFDYAQHNPCDYVWRGQQLNIKRAVDNLLRTVQRKQFDPFRRRGTELVVGQPGLRSTVAQLLFFKWIQQTGVLNYAREHAAQIRESMRLKTRKRKR
jgi:hypothetical protein